jgi:hypothetical protein
MASTSFTLSTDDMHRFDALAGVNHCIVDRIHTERAPAWN